jgi:ABC-type Mn2+/Zn2+ transport system ATPase subunit
MNGAAVTLTSVDAGYKGHPVVSDVDVTVAAGGMLALCGGNGSGKSTLIRTLAGILPAVSGTVTVLGLPPGRRPARVAYLAQHHHDQGLLPLRVSDVVRMGRYADRELSGGQRRRVHLAQVLAHRGDVLLLDEATAGIDAAGRERYFALLAEERARGAAVVVATHDFDEARLADTAVLLARRVVAAGPPADVLTRDNLAATFGVSVTEVGSSIVAAETHH